MDKPKSIFFVEVKDSKIQGKGVFATKDFKKNDVIGVITGRVPTMDDPDSPYTIAFEDVNENWWHLEPEWPFKYLNHDENHNADYDSPVLIAVRSIKAGDEITINYGEEYIEELKTLSTEDNSENT